MRNKLPILNNHIGRKLFIKDESIMKNIGYEIYKDFDRLEEEKIRKFKEIPPTVIGDTMNKTAALPSSLVPLNQTPLLGSAYTVSVTPGDNTLVYYAIDNAKPGDVIVVSGLGFTERAILGEMMVTLAIKRGLNGLVIHGAIRDKEEISKLDFPVYAVSSTSNGPLRNGPGTVNTPIAIGNRVIYPGDIVVGDQSGIVTFHPEDADDLYEASLKALEKENKQFEAINRDDSLDLSWLYEKIEADNYQIKEKFTR